MKRGELTQLEKSLQSGQSVADAGWKQRQCQKFVFRRIEPLNCCLPKNCSRLLGGEALLSLNRLELAGSV